ncbi:MAG: bifunctional DNA primase/polymerase, partial [Acidobacteria bacterium]|nr:bifunctional DNA primase/polymerase [Acidobacteriota bacterium]
MRNRPLENPKMLCHALHYARRGLPVIPIYEPVGGACSCGNPDCGNNVAKHPRNFHGVSEATTDHKAIKRWWGQWREANIGISCNGMIVVDVDAKKGGYISLEKLETDLGKLPDTWICDTGGGGKHYFFRRNGINVKNATALRLGVDLKTDGGYVVAAPALHASGKRYRWAPESGRELADFPKEWLPLLNGGTSERKPRFDTAGALAGVPEGKRDDTCWRLACKLRNADVPYDMALSLVLEAAAKCTPNFSADIAREKVERAYRQYGPKKADERPPHPADDYPGSEGDYSTESDYEQPGPQSWETPSPFYETDLPEFPVQALPAAVGEYVSAIATATQTPVDLAGMLALSVLAASCSKKVKVQIRPGFVEPVNLYTVTAIASANRKSAVYKAMLEPLESYEAAECKRTAADIARQTARYKILEKSYQRAQEAAAKASGPEKREMLTQEAE